MEEVEDDFNIGILVHSLTTVQKLAPGKRTQDQASIPDQAPRDAEHLGERTLLAYKSTQYQQLATRFQQASNKATTTEMMMRPRASPSRSIIQPLNGALAMYRTG